MMDSFLITLIDAICLATGKGTVWLLRRAKISIPQLSDGSLTVIGAALFACLGVALTFAIKYL